MISLESSFSELLFTRREELVLDGCAVTTVDFGEVSMVVVLLDLVEGRTTLDGGVGTFPVFGTALLPLLLVVELLEGAATGVEVRGATGTALGLVRTLALVPNDGASLRGVGFWD